MEQVGESPLQMTSKAYLEGNEERIQVLLTTGHQHYAQGQYVEAQALCEQIYQTDAFRTENLLLLGAIHFQLRNYSECIFYNQQSIRIDPNFAEPYGNLGNALKELGDVDGAIQFYLKAIKLRPRFCDAYNNLASAYMQKGATKQAVETYQMALVLNPSLVDAHSNLGNLLKAQGRLEDAKRCYLEAIRIRPDFAIAWSNLAGVFKDQGELDTAIAYYGEAIRLAPTFADAHSNLGNALKEAGRVADAKVAYGNALRLRPDFAIAHGNLASCCYDEGDITRAIAMYKHAIQLEPNFPDAHNNLGNALREGGRLEEAILHYRAALKIKPDHPHAYNNLGNALKDKGMVKEAIHCYMTACRLMPRFAAAHSNLGSVLKEQGKLPQAIAHYQEAIAIDPMFADAYSNLGNAHKDAGQLDEAIRCYTTAIRLKPHFADAYSNLASAYKEGGRIDDAITCYRKAMSLRPDFPDAFSNLVHSLITICDWRSYDENFRQIKATVMAQLAKDAGALPSVQPFHAFVYPFGLDLLRQLAERYARRAMQHVQLLEMPPFRFRARKPRERLRVGYVSSDFGHHPLSHLINNFFTFHDRSKVEVFCYALSRDDQSKWRRHIETNAEHFTDVSEMEHNATARLIHSDGIHILVNLNGYTKGGRSQIFALKPAPLAVNLLGFCGTLGADYIDYMVTDEQCVPPTPEFTQHYAEKLLYMPHSYFPNDHKQSARDVLDPDKCFARDQFGIPEDKFVFCCFNQMYKITPAIFDVWMNILKRVPNSLLWLLRFPALGEANIRAEARARGVDQSRIVFTDVSPKDEHLKRSYCADLFLDTPACNAHTTGCDVLWSGTPMITMPMQLKASRVASSLLRAAGLPELVTATLAEYEELAVDLALNMDRLWELRKRLEDARETCALFDTRRYVCNLEQGFELIWRLHENGEAPRHVKVEDAAPLILPPPQPEVAAEVAEGEAAEVAEGEAAGEAAPVAPTRAAAPAVGGEDDQGDRPGPPAAVGTAVAVGAAA